MIHVLRLVFFLGAAAMLSAAEPVLTVTAPGKSLTFTAEEFAALPHLGITATDPHARKEHRYDGVTVHELLVRAGAPLGDKLRGAALQLVVTVRSRDGYAVVFALADFDDAFTSRTILLAEKEDGQALPENVAPFRLIAPGDKKAARWARMVTSLDVAPAASASAAARP